jgi:hypothetical protein
MSGTIGERCEHLRPPDDVMQDHEAVRKDLREAEERYDDLTRGIDGAAVIISGVTYAGMLTCAKTAGGGCLLGWAVGGIGGIVLNEKGKKAEINQTEFQIGQLERELARLEREQDGQFGEWRRCLAKEVMKNFRGS